MYKIGSNIIKSGDVIRLDMGNSVFEEWYAVETSKSMVFICEDEYPVMGYYEFIEYSSNFSFLIKKKTESVCEIISKIDHVLKYIDRMSFAVQSETMMVEACFPSCVDTEDIKSFIKIFSSYISISSSGRNILVSGNVENKDIARSLYTLHR